MGIGQFLGTALGSFVGGGSGTVIAKGLGGLLGEGWDNRRAEKKNLYNDSQRFIRLRQAAEAGGFHPLEVLRAGGAAPTQSQPRLMSTTAAANAHDGLETFMQARREETQRAKDAAEAERNKRNSSVLGANPTNPKHGNAMNTDIGEDINTRLDEDDIGKLQPDEILMKALEEGNIGALIWEYWQRNTMTEAQRDRVENWKKTASDWWQKVLADKGPEVVTPDTSAPRLQPHMRRPSRD